MGGGTIVIPFSFKQLTAYALAPALPKQGVCPLAKRETARRAPAQFPDLRCSVCGVNGGVWMRR